MTPAWFAKIENFNKAKCCWRCEMMHTHILLMGVETGTTTFETCTFLLGDMIKSVHRSIIHSSVKLHISKYVIGK